MTLALRIREIRESEGLSRIEFAEKTGIKQRTIETLEYRQTSPNSDILFSIVKAFPQYAYWLISGNTIPLFGQIKPSEKIPDNTLRPNPTVSELDLELLQTIIEAVEEALIEIRRKLAPDKKAKIIALLYEQYSEQQENQEKTELDIAGLIKLIDLAA